MADWVHCNKCFSQPAPTSGIKYYLTNCGHIFCEKCIVTGKQNDCPVCHTEYTTILLSANLNPDIDCFFSDPEDLLQKYKKVTDFQHTHRKKLFAHLSKELQIVQQKYAQAKEHIKKITRVQLTLEKDNQRLRDFLKPAPGSTPRKGTPLSGVGGTPTPNHPARPCPPNSSGRNPNHIIRGREGSAAAQTANYSSNSTWMHHNQSRVPTDQSSRHQYDSNERRSQVTSNRLSLPRSYQYRTPTQDEFQTPVDKNSSYKSNVSLACSSVASGPCSSGVERRAPAGGMYPSPINMSHLSLDAKGYLVTGRK